MAAVSQTPSPVSDSMANATTGVGPNTGVANNKPVGSAGQPANPKMAALKRRLDANTQRKQGNL